jgi:TPR repeat protein
MSSAHRNQESESFSQRARSPTVSGMEWINDGHGTEALKELLEERRRKRETDFSLLKMAAERGDAVAQVRLGILHEYGRHGLPKDDCEAVRLYELAANQNNSRGQSRLAFFYTEGRGGLPKNDREAARLYKLAADQGNANAQTSLGLLYEQGRGGLPKDDHEAVRLYKLAANQANAYARVALGLLYERGGGGLPKDDREAVRLYKLAADQGEKRAQYHLACIYLFGWKGLLKDAGEATRYFRLAADQGNAFALFELAVLYYEGRGGLPKSDNEAVRLLKLAVDRGLPEDHPGAERLFKLAEYLAHAPLERPRLQQRADQRISEQTQQQHDRQHPGREAAAQGDLFPSAAITPTAAPTPSTRGSAGYIYILKPRISIDGQEVVKIGMTTRAVAERVRELTTGSMVSFEVVYSLHVENARNFEKYLHARYRDRRLIAGGGQEFFAVPAQEVVAEVERRATEISRARAQSARNADLAAFLVRIGAARVESRISGRLGWPLFACWLFGTFGIYRIAGAIVGDTGAWWLTISAALVVLPVILSVTYDRLKRHSMVRYYEPRFRAAIDAKHQELRVKYPLAYT